MHGRVHDDVGALGELLDLGGGGGHARRRGRVVAGIAADHHAAGRRIHAIGGMARDMGGADRAHLDVARRPDRLRLVPRIEGHDICHGGGSAFQASRILGASLRDLAGRNEGLADMRDEFPAADGEAERRGGVAAAHHVELRRGGGELPAMLEQVDQSFAVVRMHVGDEHRIELAGLDADLREPERGPRPASNWSRTALQLLSSSP